MHALLDLANMVSKFSIVSDVTYLVKHIVSDVIYLVIHVCDISQTMLTPRCLLIWREAETKFEIGQGMVCVISSNIFLKGPEEKTQVGWKMENMQTFFIIRPNLVVSVNIWKKYFFPSNLSSSQHSQVGLLLTNEEQKKVGSLWSWHLDHVPIFMSLTQTYKNKIAALWLSFPDFKTLSVNSAACNSTTKVLWVCLFVLSEDRARDASTLFIPYKWLRSLYQSNL